AGLWADVEFVSCPDCGLKLMEDWVVLARGGATRSLKRSGGIVSPAPRELQLLAAECNLMRWRTTRGLVDETRWNQFVQYVRRSVEHFGLTSTRHAWPDEKNRVAARRLQYTRLDY
ncbi:unnamed protein product, partial [Effrenium voratum]